VKPSFPFPSGTGMWIAGGNHHTVRFNHFWDNWRRGTMIFSVPDALVCGPAADGNEQHGCDDTKISTSHYNQTYDNIMDQRPDGKVDRNGEDFWWDDFPASRGNCWFRNSSPLGITTSPSGLPDCSDGTDPSLSFGTGDPVEESELLICASAFETRQYDGNPCPWLSAPKDPGDGDQAMGGGATTPVPRMANFPAARASGLQPAADVPLGQMACRDWNAARGATDRTVLMHRIQAFIGGPINSATTLVGHGPRLSDQQTATLFDNWCGPQLSQGFLLYKLYVFSADFAPEARVLGLPG
jgi:hypothetical protein